MAGSDFTLVGGRIGNADRSWAAAQDIDVAGWDKANDFIVAAMVETGSHGGASSTLRLEWQDLDDPSPTWVALGNSGELNYNGVTDLVNGNAVIHSEEGVTPTQPDHDDGIEREGANDVGASLTDKTYHQEFQWAVDPSGAEDGHEYEFRLYDVTAGAVVGTLLCTITMASGAQILQPSGIAGAEAFGTALLILKILTSSIGSAEAFGTPQINQQIAPTGIVSAEAHGMPTVFYDQFLSPSGIGSEEAFGSPQANLEIEPSSIGSAEAFGAPTLIFVVEPSGITSEEAFGSPQLNLKIEPSGIASEETFGIPNVSLGAQTIEPSGIASVETFGTPVLAFVIQPGGIASAEAFGNATVVPGAVTLLPSGIASGEAFGTLTLTIYLQPTGIATEEAIGSPTLAFVVQPPR